MTRFLHAVRHPLLWLDDITGAGPAYPLLILFCLNAVDELDRTGFGILIPEIREEFGLDLEGVLALIALVGLISLLPQVLIAYYADRVSRVAIALGGAVVWAFFSFATGLTTTLWMLIIVRSGSGIGRAVVDPTHNSLLADWYEPNNRPRVFSLHRAANAVGSLVGPISAGLLAFAFGWRTPFFIFAVPTLIVVVLGLRLRDPVRGAWERRSAGADEAAVATEEDVPSFAEGWRIVWKIESLRRIWYSLPFLAASLIGFVALAALLYEDAFGLDVRARGFVAAGVEPAQLIGLAIGARVGVKLVTRDPGLLLRFLAWLSAAIGALLVVFALAPWLALAVVVNAVVTGSLAIVGPGILAALSLAIPPRARSMGFAVGSLWLIPGLAVLPALGAIGDRWGIRAGMLLLVPVFVIGGIVISRAGTVITRDIGQVWLSTAALSSALYDRRHGDASLLAVRGLDVSYDNLQVLFGVDLEIDEGEVVALLGTNGAGKSTLLKSISGLVQADKGAVIFDGRDITAAPPHEIARRGVVQMPGGAGTFPSLSVRENLRVAGWMQRGDARSLDAATADVLERFPQLVERLDDPAANLSGGQQQMLALAMAFLGRPRLLMIDELTLGLAPIIVEQLLPQIEQLAEAGTTVILVEQSVNLALTVADRAYFMEKGEIRYSGPTSELLQRKDILRSVFLAGAEPLAAEQSSPAKGDGDLVVDNLAVAFGGLRAVEGVSLAVAAGEIVGVLGPNGAGKTTLLDGISGFTVIDGDSVRLGERDLTSLAPHARARLGLGRSFQDARLFPSLTVEETVAVALERWIDVRDPVAAALHLPAAADSEQAVHVAVDELLDVLGLTQFRHKFVRELSTGSRRIVDLACVLAHRPSVVLLDEPSSGIAQRETEALGPLLVDVRARLGASLLIVEHDMPLLSSVADRLVAMDRGSVISEGRPADVLADDAVIEAYLGRSDSLIDRSGPAKEDT